MGRTLAIDIETYSDVDLISCGVYKYSSSPYFEILLIAYSVDDKETVCIDVANGEEPPKEFMEMLFDDTVTKQRLMQILREPAFQIIISIHSDQKRGDVRRYRRPC